MSVLREQVEHHVQEEGELFPVVRRACSSEELEEMGGRVQALAERLEAEGHPSRSIPDQTDEPAPI